MIPTGVQVFLALEPVDMRYGFGRLAGIVRERIGYDARGEALFVFVGKRRQTIKVLFFDGSGLCLFYKGLDRSSRRDESGLRPAREPCETRHRATYQTG